MIALRIWPGGLVGRVILVLIAAIALEYIGGAVLLEWEVIGGTRTGRMERLAWQVANAARIVDRVPAGRRATLVADLSDDMLRLEWQAMAPPETIRAGEHRHAGLIDVAASLLEDEAVLQGRTSLRATGEGGLDLAGEVALPAGLLRFTAPGLLDGLPPGLEVLLSSAFFAAAVSLAAIMVVRELGAPLRGLARIVDRIGGPQPVLVEEAGPREVRKVARTLNAMQTRIRKLIDDRTQALAAVSHDLRTPIARMRLQADFVVDPQARLSMIESLDDMEHMVASVLTYLAGETDTETPRPVDLALLLVTRVDAACDAGGDVRYEGPSHARAVVRPVLMKRAFANLIGNAVAYGGGGEVVVRLEARDDALVVQVDDNGPGIPPADLARALEPFCRLEPSRGRNSGGVGLGLSIVMQAMEREGGTLTLSNRSEGGLRAQVTLPRTA